MDKNNVISLPNRDDFQDALTELIRDGARQILACAFNAEVSEFLDRFKDQTTEQGHRAVVRSGYQPERDILTGVGPVKVKIPKVRSNTGEPVSFRSCIVPPYLRKSGQLENFAPWLYLKGVSTGEMQGALEPLLGPQAAGFSPSVVSRLTREWQAQLDEWRQRDLSNERFVYWWVDGIYCGVRTEDVKLCALVIIGVNERGEKKFLAIEDGVRESTISWREVLLNMKARGLAEPELAIGDGSMGFWAALDEVYPNTRQQRCWVHKTANVLNKLPKSVQVRAKPALQEIWMAETRKDAEQAFDEFVSHYQDKYPKAVECLVKDREELLVFYDFPAAHWQSIRTTNPIESTFATIRHRTRLSKGCLNRQRMLCMMFKLSECAQENWRRMRGFKQLDKVIKGVQFKDGIEVKQVAA